MDSHDTKLETQCEDEDAGGHVAAFAKDVIVISTIGCVRKKVKCSGYQRKRDPRLEVLS